jgi:hypothetical protein
MARRLGTTEHLSPLLRKARLLGLGTLGDLSQLAVQRGCRYYADGSRPQVTDPGLALLGNDELAVALLHGGQPWSPQATRLGAAMLGAPGLSAPRVARLARMERCETVIRHVAEAGRHFEPGNPFWSDLLELLPTTSAAPEGVLPHPTRYVAMTGLTRSGRGLSAIWIRPIAQN